MAGFGTAPTGLTATSGTGQISLSWTAASSASTYNIYRGTTSNGEGSTPYITGVTGTTYDDTSVTNGLTYYYKVSALGDSNQSSEVSAETSTLPAPIAGTNYSLVWSDEFSGSSVDTNKWNQVGPWNVPVSSTDPNFTYSTSNNTVSNGILSIRAIKDGNGHWSGGILSTDSTQTWTYAFVEVRAKLPAGQGFWPAIWMYGSGGAPELDIMEFLGGDVTTAYQTYHFSGGQHSVEPSNSDWTSDYHLFQMRWEAGSLKYYIDNTQTGSWTQSIPSNAMFLMLNFDVGASGDWGGAPDGSTPSPAYILFDYARVYQQ